MIHLFKNRFACTDVFLWLWREMVRRGYGCVRVVDEDLDDPRGPIDALVGEDVVLITSDHVADRMEARGKAGYSVADCLRLLRPRRAFFGMHDLGISTVDDDLEGLTVLLPGENWRPLFRGREAHVVGHGKFLSDRREEEREAVFFVSSVYVHAPHPELFVDAFRMLIDLGVPFKFPGHPLSPVLEEAVRAAGGTVLDSSIESFDLLAGCRTAVSNANSSIAIEAAMAGCRSVNFGWSFVPREVYGTFEVLSANDPGAHFTLDPAVVCPNRIHREFLFDMEKCISMVSALGGRRWDTAGSRQTPGSPPGDARHERDARSGVLRRSQAIPPRGHRRPL